MTFVDLPDTDSFKAKIGHEKWAAFRDNVSTLLRTYAVDGRAAAALSDGRYGVVHAEGITSDLIRENVEALSRVSDPDKKGVTVNAKVVDLENEGLTEHELARAVTYSINEFEKRGNAFNILSLESGFEAFLTENTQKIAEFKQIIHQSRFDLKFQPIINLKDGSVAYYEALVRFEDGKSPYDAIVFCEDVGLSPELDLAICGKVINYLVFSTNGKPVKIAVNLSGVSVQDSKFIEKLRQKLQPHLKTDIPKRLIFEITESSEISDLDKVNECVKALQGDGFKVSLDDFGAGAASFQYLNKIHVDTVKIDGQYITNIVNNTRDQAMISNLVKMCADLKVGVVAERVETKEHVDMLKKMGVEMGQGYYFAKPLDEPKYLPKPV
jgi:EAL domain-containing protein (putative c-di-GMP-specific phosphodiesterase class I)